MKREFLLPQQQPHDEQIPIDVLIPQMDALIERFREKLAQSTEFKDALVKNYLYGQDNLDEVEFQRGDYQYFVYLKGVPEETEEERQASLNRGVGPHTGWKTLRIIRNTINARLEDVKSEYVEMHIDSDKGNYDETETSYTNNKAGIQEVNSEQALKKAQEIIDAF